MQLTILADEHMRLDTGDGDDGLNVVGGPFGPLQMLAGSLALCIASVIHSYGETARLHLHGFGVEVRWEYVEDPYRVGRYDITLHLPEDVPPERHRAIVRAADTCTVHRTLEHPPTMETAIRTFVPGDYAPPDSHGHHHDHEA